VARNTDWEITTRVEKGKALDDKIVVPALFGRKGKILKCFNANAHAASQGWVPEVEAGRDVDNNQFLKDLTYYVSRKLSTLEIVGIAHPLLYWPQIWYRPLR
jgi:hypothetical protein